MDADLSPRLRGLTWFWWSAAGYLASQARRRLGLWPIPVKPFLPRAEQESLKALITFLEAVLRRLFWLEAAGLGALPAGTQPGPVAPAGSGTSRTPAQTPTRAAWPPAAPIFRLRECARPVQATPPPRKFRTGPRIRFLDAPHPVDLRDYSAHPADILPCGNWCAGSSPLTTRWIFRIATSRKCASVWAWHCPSCARPCRLSSDRAN